MAAHSAAFAPPLASTAMAGAVGVVRTATGAGAVADGTAAPTGVDILRTAEALH